jgi:hypothetical protein
MFIGLWPEIFKVFCAFYLEVNRKYVQYPYIRPDGKLMAAAISVNRATLEPPGASVALFQTRIYGGTNSLAGC